MRAEQTILPVGQQHARSRWGTQASGEAFDRKKSLFLTEQAQQFMKEQTFCVISGLDQHDELGGFMALEKPGFIQIINEYMCLIQLDHSLANTGIMQRLCHSTHEGQEIRLALFFICHPTRERLCVHGTVELLSRSSSEPSIQPTAFIYERLQHISLERTNGSQFIQPFEPLWLRLHVRQAFFHCAKYIRTCVEGLTSPMIKPETRISRLDSSISYLTKDIQAFIAEQVLCFLCTVDQMGQCAVNHRNGHRGFLGTLPPDVDSPGGTLFLPDYSGNGAFEAIGNIFETGQAALVIPNYAAQMALCVSGSAHIVEMDNIPVQFAHACVGAQRVVVLSVQRVEIQHGNWSTTLAYEQARAERILFEARHDTVCHL